LKQVIRGKVWKYEDNVDTDVIIPARYLNRSDPKELAEKCMEDIDKTFVKEVKEGDIMVAGENFGCGSSREHAPIAIKASGISVIIAKTFARIFYRNAINIGLPILECPEAAQATDKGDELEVNIETGVIKNLTKKQTFQAKSYPESLRELINAGGLIEYTRKKVGVS
jgi:3-isopropylmalate/(R)-2-methylmalate dehydratase small subunit